MEECLLSVIVRLCLEPQPGASEEEGRASRPGSTPEGGEGVWANRAWSFAARPKRTSL